METGELIFLGTGASAGVPLIGCHCSVCLSSSSFNKRLRPSVLIKVSGKTVVIDVGPDFRTQALLHRIDKLDGVLLTHSHYDHVGGIDDLRAFYFTQHNKLPCLLSQETFDELKIRCHYLMQPLKDGHTICAQLDFKVLEKDFGNVLFGGLHWQYMSYFQAKMKVTGFRLGNMAYVSDIREYTDELLHALKGVEVLILSALRDQPSHMHLSTAEAIDFAQKIGAKKTWLTHVSHEMDYEETNQKLPQNVRLSYDGLKIPFTDAQR
jgi:phosphoribosyl 1,2-cyclic phosphate phosphodiesterase